MNVNAFFFPFSDMTHARFTPNTGGNQGNAKPVMQNTVETFPNQSLKNPAFSPLAKKKVKWDKLRLFLYVEDTGYITIERRLTNILFLLFSSFLCPSIPYCFTSSVSSTPNISDMCPSYQCFNYTYITSWIDGNIFFFLSPAVNSFSEAFNKLHNEEEQELASYTNDGKII